MSEWMNLERGESFDITDETMPKLPQNLLDRFAKEIIGFVHESDFEMFLDDYADVAEDFPVNFTHDSFGASDIAHPIIPLFLDPEADNLTYVQIANDDSADLHLVVASGSNPMGFVMEDDGTMVGEIYDGLVREPGATTYTQNAFGAAIRLMWLYAERGQRVRDLKQTYFEKDPAAAEIVFGDAG